jgi:hypothetical protein
MVGLYLLSHRRHLRNDDAIDDITNYGVCALNKKRRHRGSNDVVT